MNEEAVFSTWNSFRSQRNRKGVWKGCGMLDGFTKSTIRAACKAHGGPERILAAIANYHQIWHGKEYKWTYAWTLCEFLTRKKQGVPQIRRFLPGNFRADSYLTEYESKKRKVAQARQVSEALEAGGIKADMKRVDDHIPKKKNYQQILKEKTEVQLVDMWEKNAFNRMLITKKLPEFAEKMRRKQFKAKELNHMPQEVKEKYE